MALLYLRHPILSLCLVLASAEAYTKFDPICSVPTTPVNFVSSPNSRGTLDILWSSLFTIIACTWTIQHLNVPEQRNDRNPGWVDDLKWKLKGFLQSAKWMVITMIAPEFIMGMACYDLSWAKRYHRELQKFAFQDHVPWTLAHTHYANMGGFVIQSGVQEDVRAIPSVSENGESYPYHNPYHLTALEIYMLRVKGTLPKLPYISKEELGDKSKSNSFIKAIAIFQIIWATVQIIVRTVRKIAISQLELAVIAFAACAVIIYLLYWSKPKSISTVTTILQYQGQIPKDIIENCTHDVTKFRSALFLAKAVVPKQAGARIENDMMEVPTGAMGDNEQMLAVVVMIFGATLFGGIHIGAWNFEFPSWIELISWRCASVFSTAYGITLSVLTVIIAKKAPNVYRIVRSMWTFLYAMTRLFLLVEIFRTLCFLPPDAYISTWTTNIPHVI